MRNFTFLLVSLFYSQILFSQWTSDTAVNTLIASSNSGDAKSLTATTGETYVVFWKAVGAPENYELRMQVLDSDGNKQMGEDGMLISDMLPMSTYTAIWSLTLDALDNLYIGITCTGDASGRVFKMNSLGDFVWGNAGVVISGTAYMVTVLPMSNGEAIASWNPGGQALMQKYDATGTEVWGAAQNVVTGAGDSSPGNMYEMDNDSFMIAYHVIGTGIYSTLYAQKFDENAVSQWASPVQLSNKTTVFNTTYSGCQDGNVAFLGYKASSGTRFDSFLQRINDDGTLPWGINGMDFDTNQTNYEMDTDIAIDENSEYVWSVCNYTNPSQNNAGVYIQKFDKFTGARQLTDNAKEVYPISSAYQVHQGNLQLINDQPIFLLENGNSLEAVLLDADGNFAWTEHQKPVATYNAEKGRIHFNAPVNNQLVTTFVENKGTGAKIYAQNFTDLGLGIEDFTTGSGKIYFNNPVKDLLKINSESPINNIKIFSPLGQCIESISVNDQSSEIIISTTKWQSGMNIMQIEMESGIVRNFRILKT